jgi:two-component system response regulator AlgR
MKAGPLRLTILICDDEPPARQRARAQLEEIQEQMPNRVLAEAENGQQALDRIEEWRPDVVLLDIRMPGMDGMEVARHVARLEPPIPELIFLTAYDEFALHAFEVQAIDYLLKPVRSSRLLEALWRVKKRQQENTVRTPIVLATSLAETAAIVQLSRRHVSVIERGRLLLVPVREVIYFKAEMKYVTLKTLEREYVIEETLNTLEKEFGDLFVRIHRNSLVARAAIAGLEKKRSDATEPEAETPYRVLLRGLPETLPVSRRQWGQIKEMVRSML